MSQHAQRTRRRHFNYSNVMSTLAVFLVIAGGSALAAALPKNSVKSKTVKDNSLKSKDLKDGKAVAGADVVAGEVQLRVGESCPEGQAIRVINVQGGVICEVDDQGAVGGPPSGPAGGDLTGTYPNPDIAANAVGSGEIADNGVLGADIADNAVGDSELATDSVGTDKISQGAVTATELHTRAFLDFDFGVTAANTCIGFGFAIPGAASNHAVIVDVPETQPDNLIVQASSSTGGNIRLRVCNPSNTATVDPPNATYAFFLLAS